MSDSGGGPRPSCVVNLSVSEVVARVYGKAGYLSWMREKRDEKCESLGAATESVSNGAKALMSTDVVDIGRSVSSLVSGDS